DLSDLYCGFAGGINSTEAQVKNLTNCTTYKMAVAAVDAAGNIGPLSALTCGMPQLVDSFDTKLLEAGGGPGNGFFCSVRAPGGGETPGERWAGAGIVGGFGLIAGGFCARLVRRAHRRRRTARGGAEAPMRRRTR